MMTATVYNKADYLGFKATNGEIVTRPEEQSLIYNVANMEICRGIKGALDQVILRVDS